MKTRFGMFKRTRKAGAIYYVKDKVTGKQETLGTRDRDEALRMVQGYNERHNQPQLNAALARIYQYGADPAFGERTWQDVMEDIANRRFGPTRDRWLVAIRAKAFDCIRGLKVAETRPEQLHKALRKGGLSTNVFLRRIHNHAVGMDWLLRPIIPQRQWPRVVPRKMRAITEAEHLAIIEREGNPERRDFYEVLWYIGAGPTDAANLKAEDIDWENRTISYTRKKLEHLGTSVEPALIAFGDDLARVLRRRPRTGPLFPYLCTVRTNDRASEFRQRCAGLGIKGVSLYSYRYSWAQRAKRKGYPLRFAQQALGHNSKAVHLAYAKQAEVKIPCLEDWGKQLETNSQAMEKPEVVAVNFVGS